MRQAARMPPTKAVREARERVVREHMESENVHDFDTTIGTFDHPRYELIATGEVHDGEAAVRAYFAETRRAFPDQRNELLELHHMDDGVAAEFILKGTHEGELRGIPPTGKSFEVDFCTVAHWDNGQITEEYLFYDLVSFMQQLGLSA